MSDFVPHAPENGHLFILRSILCSRVLESIVNPLFASREKGTGLVGMITDGHHIIKFLIKELPHTFGMMVGDVDPNLSHDANGQGVYPRGLGSCAMCFIVVTVMGIHQSLCHV